MAKEHRKIHAIRTQKEVAEILKVSRSVVQQLEMSALKKMSRHPLMRELAEHFDIKRWR